MKTIKDIAIEAKVSPGTVDRVLHNRPGVSLKTKEKVQKLLTKYNFEKNVFASTLAFKNKFTIATIIPSAESEKEFWEEPDKGIKAAIKEIQKYGIETQCFYFDKYDLDSYEKAFEDMLKINPNGVLMTPFFYKKTVEFTAKLNAKKIPYVFINIDVESMDNVAFIGQNSYQSGYLAGKLLSLKLEDNKEVLIIRSKKYVDNHGAISSRIKGFLSYFKEKNTSVAVKEVYLETFDTNEVANILASEFSKNEQLKGVFVPSSAVFKVAEYLETIPKKEISLIGYDSHEDNIKYLKNETIDFLISQNPYEQGYMGVKIIFEYLLFNKIPNKKYSSPIHIITKENADYI